MNDRQLTIYQPDRSALDRRPADGFIHASAHAVAHDGLDLVACWRIIRKHWRTVLITFLVATLGAGIWTELQKKVYRATAMLEIERQSPNIPTAQDLFALDTVSEIYLETQYKIITDKALAEQVVNEIGLDRVKEFSPSEFWWFMRRHFGQMPPAGVRDEAAYQKSLDLYQSALDVLPIRRSRLVQVTFDSQNPQLAARVVNKLSADYIEQNLRARREASQKATESLGQQLAEVGAKLEKSERALHQYASENDLVFFEIGSGSNENLVYDRLRQLQEELTKAQAARYEKESLYRLVQTGDYASLPGVYQDMLIQDLSFKLAELQQQAADLNTRFNDTYPAVKQVASQIDEVERDLTRERTHAAERITKDYTSAVERESLARHDLEAQQAQANLIASRLTEYNVLKREEEADNKLHDVLMQRLSEAAVAADLKPSEVRVVYPATPSQTPVKPIAALNVGLGGVFGLLLGTCIAFLKKRPDKTVSSPEEVERVLSLRSLAWIPAVPSLNGRDRGLPPFGNGWLLPIPPMNGNRRRNAEAAAQSALAEAFRSLSVSVLYSPGTPPRSILVASARPREGRTTVATNLAKALSESGERVLLIDADMRNPMLHELLGLAGKFNPAGCVGGDGSWQSMVQPTRIERVDVLPCGPVPQNSARLFSSEEARRIVSEAEKEYRFVVLDSPPLLDFVDGRILASFVEGVVLVVKSGSTPSVLVERAETCIRSVGGNLIGVALNYLDRTDSEYARS